MVAWRTLSFPTREQSTVDLDKILDALLQLPQFAPYYDENYNLQASVRVGFNAQEELEVSFPEGRPTIGISDAVAVEIGDPYAPGAFVLAAGRYSVMASELRLVGSQRAFLLGNSRLRII